MAKRYKFENTTRDVILIPVAAGGNEQGFLVLGDSIDVEARLPKAADGKRVRDPKLQPNPVRFVTLEEYDAFGELGRDLLADQVAQGRIVRTELAA